MSSRRARTSPPTGWMSRRKIRMTGMPGMLCTVYAFFDVPLTLSDRRDPSAGVMNPAARAIGTTQATTGANSRRPSAATPGAQTRPGTTATAAFGGGAPSPSYAQQQPAYGTGGYSQPYFTNNAQPQGNYSQGMQMGGGYSDPNARGASRMNQPGIPGTNAASSANRTKAPPRGY